MKILFRPLGHAPFLLDNRDGASRAQPGYYTNRTGGVTPFLRGGAAGAWVAKSGLRC